MKKKIMFIGSLICNVLLILTIIVMSNQESEIFSSNNSNSIKKDYSGALSMLYETEAGSGNYNEVDDNAFPQEGYVFNATLSKCENGSELSWDEESKQVVMMGNVSDKCYVYFDIEVPKVLLSDYVKSLYTGTQGENNIYYHKNLTNSAEDNSYRYAGSYENVNNYVCFGSDETTCPYDNLYRIIGVFGSQVKLIKADYAKSTLLGTSGDYKSTYKVSEGSSNWGTNKGSNKKEEIGGYYWNYSDTTSSTNIWAESRLNKENLNGTYLNSFSPTWQAKIVTTTWKVGGNTFENISEKNAPTIYQNEILNPSENTTESKKIGLMYISDYMYGAKREHWTKLGFNGSDSSQDYQAAINDNWLYNGLKEWTILPRSYSDYGYGAFRIHNAGLVEASNVYSYGLAVRPVFYLESTVVKGLGTGTISDPMRIQI